MVDFLVFSFFHLSDLRSVMATSESKHDRSSGGVSSSEEDREPEHITVNQSASGRAAERALRTARTNHPISHLITKQNASTLLVLVGIPAVLGESQESLSRLECQGDTEKILPPLRSVWSCTKKSQATSPE